MKKLLIAGMTLAGAIGVFAQGALVFNNFATATPNVAGVNVVFHIYSPQLVDTGTVTGNSSVAYSTSVRSGDFPTGTQTYTGALLGGSTVGTGATGWANGNDYSVDLVAAPGDNAALSSLVLVAGTTTTFRTTSAAVAGWFVAPSTDPTIPGTTFSGSGDIIDPTSASVAVQAWYSGNGAYPTYAAAVAADVPHGQGAEFNVDGLGGGTISPPNLANGQSFSLTTYTVPEPGMIALGVMGACAFLARRRMLKK